MQIYILRLPHEDHQYRDNDYSEATFSLPDTNFYAISLELDMKILFY